MRLQRLASMRGWVAICIAVGQFEESASAKILKVLDGHEVMPALSREQVRRMNDLVAQSYSPVPQLAHSQEKPKVKNDMSPSTLNILNDFHVMEALDLEDWE